MASRNPGMVNSTPPVVVGSLCSGYGGLDLGLQLALNVPVRHAWHVEYDKHPSLILAHHWPDVPNYGDLTSTQWERIERVDWLTAGYPCQPFSHAGLRKGKTDERHLWPHVARAVSCLRPRNVLLENVWGHVSLGLDAVVADLTRLGYDARWGVVRASDAGAPHGRARVFIVATDTTDVGHERVGRARDGRPGPGNRYSAATDPNCAGLEGHRGLHPAPREVQVAAHGHGDVPDTPWGVYGPAIRRWEQVLGRAAPPPTERGKGGQRLSPRFVEFMMGLPAGWVTDVLGLPRNAQLKALGNGVVPQQAAAALRALGVAS